MLVTSVLPFIAKGKELSTAFRNTTTNRSGRSNLTFPQTKLQPVFEGIQPTGRGFDIKGYLGEIADVLGQHVFAIISNGHLSGRPRYYEKFFKQVEPKDEVSLNQLLRVLENQAAERQLNDKEKQALITKSVSLFFELRLQKYLDDRQYIDPLAKEGEEVSPESHLQGLIGTNLSSPKVFVEMLVRNIEKNNLSLDSEYERNLLNRLNEAVTLIKIAKRYNVPLSSENQRAVSYLVNAKERVQVLIQTAEDEGRVLTDKEERWVEFVLQIPVLNQENEESKSADKKMGSYCNKFCEFLRTQLQRLNLP